MPRSLDSSRKIGQDNADQETRIAQAWKFCRGGSPPAPYIRTAPALVLHQSSSAQRRTKNDGSDDIVVPRCGYFAGRGSDDSGHLYLSSEQLPPPVGPAAD